MSVLYLTTARFEGFRVRRTINGQTREKWFHVLRKRGGEWTRLGGAEREKLREQAERHDANLARWQQRGKQERKALALPSSRNSTGVKGISLGCLHDRGAGKTHYRYPAFIVSCRDLTGRSVKKGFVINVHGYAGAWQRAVRFLVKIKNLPRQSMPTLLERLPANRTARRRERIR